MMRGFARKPANRGKDTLVTVKWSAPSPIILFLRSRFSRVAFAKAFLSPQYLHFRAARLARGVTSKLLLAGHEELFGATVV